MKFKDLKVGARFVFPSEYDPRFRTTGMAKGPWVKLSARMYQHFDDPFSEPIEIGTINAGVMSWPVKGV